MERLRNFFNKIIRGDSPESSKRLIAIWSMALVTYVVVRYTSNSNTLAVLGTLTTFILALLGVAAWEKFKAKKEEDIKK